MPMQKCPVCNGSGYKFTSFNHSQCHVCKGCGIIDEITGLPPYEMKLTTQSTTIIHSPVKIKHYERHPLT